MAESEIIQQSEELSAAEMVQIVDEIIGDATVKQSFPKNYLKIIQKGIEDGSINLSRMNFVDEIGFKECKRKLVAEVFNYLNQNKTRNKNHPSKNGGNPEDVNKPPVERGGPHRYRPSDRLDPNKARPSSYNQFLTDPDNYES